MSLAWKRRLQETHLHLNIDSAANSTTTGLAANSFFFQIAVCKKIIESLEGKSMSPNQVGYYSPSFLSGTPLVCALES